MGALAELATALREEGGLLAEALAEAPADGGGDIVVEAIREGYLQHYGAGRVVRPDDPDLALLAGDRLYALGLARLAAHGDLEMVIRLADVISRCAQAHAEGDPAGAEAVWSGLRADLGAPESA